MPLQPGAKLGPYEILSALETANGTDLYKASDTRLNREVAIKVFAGHFSERFESAARALASLSHPNICALHDIGHEDGLDFLVMEYLEGQTLAERLQKGALGLDQAITMASAIADALDKAHREGVTHRDLNPSKVMLTPTGVKLLDFGLTVSTPLPAAGSSLKTLSLPGGDASLQYMAPEQLEGKEPDARSDIFAFGAIFYEMITGTKAFEGKSRAVLIAAIATADPDPLSKTQPGATPGLQHIVERCLAKDPDDRWQTAHDLLVQLRWVSEGGGHAPGAAPVRKHQKWVRIALAAAALLIVALAYPAALYLRGPSDPGSFQFRVPVRGLSPADIALSPDGETIALVARPNTGEPASLYVRRAGSVAFTKLGGTDDASQPFWSADSRFIAFVAGSRLKQVSATGGAPKDIAAVQGFSGGAWNKEGTILYGSAKGVFRVSAEGGTPAAVTTVDAQETGHFWPSFLPDGKHFLYLAWSGQAANRGVFVGALDSKEKKRILTAQSNAQYAAPGYIVFHREASVFAQPFDAKKLALSGDPFHIADEVSSTSTNGRGDFDVSQNGSLLYFQGGTGGQLVSNQAAVSKGGIIVSNAQWGWVDRSGRLLEIAGEQGPYGDMDLSPDQKLIAVTRQDTGNPGADIWVIDWQRAGVAPTRLTLDPADDVNPVWAPDGKRIAFTTYRKGNADIYVVENGNGMGKETPLLETAADEIVEDWSKDGKYIAYLTGDADFRDIWALPLNNGKPDADKKPFPVVQGHFQKDEPQFSYDGKWLAYVSDKTMPGRFQVYVRSFPAGDQDILVSDTAGGGQPRWRKDGKELYYRAPDYRVMAVEIKAGTNLEAGVPKPLFLLQVGTETINPIRHVLAVSPDGQRFLLRVRPGAGGRSRGRNTSVPTAPATATPSGSAAAASTAVGRGGGPGPMSTGLTVIQHWTSALGKAEK
jgi:Tol biopolymer transport system component